jgi:hypothetical protein
MFKEGLLITLMKNRMLVIVILFKIKMRWAALIDYAFYMLAVDLTDVRRNCHKYFVCIPTLSSVFSLEVADNHASVESVVDGTSGGKVNSFLRDCCLISIV